jgi:glycosyltransferase involved in cell wall biosynthesis
LDVNVDILAEPQSHPFSGVQPLRVSVAMATYDGEKYIREQLESLSRQTLLPCELIITDDGSTDRTLTVVDGFAREAPFPVRIHRNRERLGYAGNFLKAASLCAGDLIAFCDQDDIWMEQKLSTCVPFFGDPEVLLAAHSAWTLLPSGQRGRRLPDYAQSGILSWGEIDPFGFPLGFAMILRKDLLAISAPPSRPEKIHGHDQWLWFLAAATGKVAKIAEALTLYRQHEANLYGTREKITVSQLAKRIAETLEYDALAADELVCAQVLMDASAGHPGRAKRLVATAHQLERRAALHRLRTRIYARGSGFLRRADTWRRIFFQAGYLPDASRTRLGPKAGVKDLVFGVTGMYRLTENN